MSFLKKVMMLSLVSLPALANESTGDSGWPAAIKAGCYVFAVALAAMGGTAAQSKAVSVALEGIARNPSAADKLFTPMILGLALMESLVIFTLISIFLV